MNLKQLYNTDYNLWLEKTIENIKNQGYENMDWDNLIEEIEDMGASQTRAFLRRLKIARVAPQKSFKELLLQVDRTYLKN